MLDELMEKWDRHMTVLRGLSPKSVESYLVKVNEFFQWLEANNKPNEPDAIRRQDVEQYMEYLFYSRRNRNYTRLTKLGAIRNFWRFMVYEEVVKSDITRSIPKPKVTKRLIQDFSKPEILKFHRAVDLKSKKGLRDISILILLGFCGLRVGEICNLRLYDILDDGQYIDIQIREEIGKQGSSRVVDLWKAPSVFIRQWVVSRIEQGADEKSFLFISFRKGDKPVGNPLTEKDVDRLVKQLGKKARIRKARVHSHMFRATHGSDLRHVRGFDIKAIAGRLGHKNISTTDRYLPRPGRVRKEYRSLRDYWREWEQIWVEGAHEECEQ